MSLQQAIDLFLFHRSKKWSYHTKSVYQGNLIRFAIQAGEKKPLASISDYDIDQFLMNLQSKVSANTVLNYANTLRSFFRYWHAKREVSVSWELIEGPKKDEKVPDFISREQFELIDEYYDEDEFFQLIPKLIFNLLWDTGMRIGELLSLNIDNIDSTKQYTYITTEKSRNARVVMWTNSTHEMLLKYLGVRICLNQDQELFQTPPSSPLYKKHRGRLSARAVQQWCKRLEEELGFRVHPHAFRHGKAHEILNQNGGRHHIQPILGHKSINSSEVYTRLNENEQIKLMKRFLQPS